MCRYNGRHRSGSSLRFLITDGLVSPANTAPDPLWHFVQEKVPNYCQAENFRMRRKREEVEVETKDNMDVRLSPLLRRHTDYVNI